MRQVPSFGLIGRGRAATQIYRLLSEHRAEVHLHHRNSDPTELSRYSFIWILISDPAIDSWYRSNKSYIRPDSLVFHGSGIYESQEGIDFLHPLAPFSGRDFSREELDQIPLVCSPRLLGSLQSLMSFLPNPLFSMDSSRRTLYHTQFSMLSSMSVILWAELNKIFQELHLPPDLFNHFLQSVLNNYQVQPNKALTGPLARNDIAALQKQFQNLENYPHLQKLYQEMSQWKKEPK